MAMGELVRKGAQVALRYVLRDEGGDELERAESESYLHGTGALPPGLEAALEGRAVGDKFTVQLAPEDAYGVRKDSAGAQPVPRATFPADATLSPGLQFEAETADGAAVALYISRVEEQVVYVDTNHPYAGRTLNYEIEVLSVSHKQT
jgi:FKBP-type peptidyl-prolyl cis-trans isomerase SlyD